MFLALRAGAIRQSDLDFAVLNFGDWQFLDWLHQSLVKSEKIEANDLIFLPLLSGKRILYKRVVTISPIWDARKPNSAFNHVKTKTSKNYADVFEFQEKFVAVMNRLLPGRGNAIATHELLIDIPPAGKDLLSFPMVYYENDVNKRVALRVHGRVRNFQRP